MRRFLLEYVGLRESEGLAVRKTVAQGVLFSCGKVALRFVVGGRGVVVYQTMGGVELDHVRGDSRGEIVWIDGEPD